MSTIFLFSKMPSNVLPLHLKQTFPHIIWLFTECEGDGIESRLLFKIVSTLPFKVGIFWEGHKFCEIVTLLLSTVHTDKSKMKILQNFVAFSDYMNFNKNYNLVEHCGQFCVLLFTRARGNVQYDFSLTFWKPLTNTDKQVRRHKF